ncbi:MAG TPA: LysE family transporter [Methanoregula sp.]|nr:LysE family transporter [Methanoregula sp.]
MEEAILSTVVLGFLIGLTGALAPGPTLVATINASLAGFLTSAANPYFWIWWLSVGSALLISSLEGGLILAVAFMAGHWGADTAWFTFVSTGVAQGKTILSDTTYHRIMMACGIFLIFFGLYYLAGPLLSR